jgi:hypothetical protein
VTAITEAALPDGSQRSAAETVPAQVAAVSASDLAHTKEAVSSAGTLDESLPDSLQTLEHETPPVQVATASTSDLVGSGAKEAASAATLDEQLPYSSQALVPETPPDGKEPVTSTETLDECLTSEACIDQYLWSVYQRAPKEDTTKVVERTKVIVKTNGKPQTVVKEYASGLKAATNRSYHGGSLRGGYGHGLAADLVSVKGEKRGERFTSSEHLWKWIDLHGEEFGIGRPYLDKDPAHVAPIDGKEYADHRRGANSQHARSETKTRILLTVRDDHNIAKLAKTARSSNF